MNKYSFEELLNNKELLCIEDIIIPKIQRDYVQGAVVFKTDNYFEINSKGKRFLDAIFDFIVSDNNNDFVLDFIYGSIKNGSFYPLDGQQRLTTLFLLYWYSTVYEMVSEGPKDNWLKLLSHFKYETRVTSTDFCKLLCGIKKSENLVPSKLVKKSNKYHSEFELDPTINAMLGMLDSIHNKFLEAKQNGFAKKMYDRLKKIKFYLLPLDDFSLDEELYVKMNARGKVLTDYENFKADFISWMKSERTGALITNDENGRPKFINIASKLDNEWSDVVFCNHKSDFDLCFFKLICRWFLSYYLLKLFNNNQIIRSNNELLGDKTISEMSRFISNISNENIYTKFETFKNILEGSDCEALSAFINFMSNYSTFEFVRNGIKAILSDESFNLASKESSTQRQITVFAGIALYLNSSAEITEDKFKNWVRFVWNAAEGTDIDSWIASAPVFKDFNKVASIATDFDIENHIGDFDTDMKNTFAKAVNFEFKKYSLMLTNDDWKDLLIQAEKNKFLKNDLAVLINDNPTICQFRIRLNNLDSIFNDKGFNYNLIEGQKHAIMRAVISHLSLDGIINTKFFDSDDKEHQLKKYLASENGITTQIRRYLDLADETAIIQTINSDLLTNSILTNRGNASYPADTCIQTAHNNLIKSETLFDAMINEKIVHILIDDTCHICARYAYGNRRSNLIEIDSNRNKLVDSLCQNGFTNVSETIVDGTKKWFYGRDICLQGRNSASDKSVSLYLNLSGTTYLCLDSGEEKIFNGFNYYSDTLSTEQKVNAILNWINSL